MKDFERLSKGEQPDTRNLQQLFSEFYDSLNEKRKNIDIKDSLNSAKASLGSLSTKLEERRKKIRDLKDKAVSKIDQDRSEKEPTQTATD